MATKPVRALGEALQRYWVPQPTVRLDTAGPPVDATAIPYGRFAAGRILCPDTIASVTLTFWECDTEDGDYYKCQSGGSDVTVTRTTAERNSCEIPAACAGCAFLKIQSNTDDAEAVTVLKKS